MPEFNTSKSTTRHSASCLILAICVGLFPLTPAKSEPTEAIKLPGPDQPQIHYGLDQLPEKTRATVKRIIAAARSGEPDELRAALEWNELPPEIGPDAKTDPINHWIKISQDGTTREIMAKILNIFDRGYIKREKNDGGTTYIWPYLAEKPLTGLSPREEVDLYRLATAEEVKSMKTTGKYFGYFAVIGEDGTWHSFMKKN